LYDYSARLREPEGLTLSFMKGDLMYIIDDSDDWWYAKKKDNEEEGYIPSNYVSECGSGLYAET
jgi:hypothetical protein